MIANVILIDIKTFETVSKWADDVRAERGSNVLISLVGNKTDIAQKRQVTREQGEAKAKEIDALFIETSAKVGSNVKALFKQIVMALPENHPEAERKSINVSISPNRSSSCISSSCAN